MKSVNYSFIRVLIIGILVMLVITGMISNRAGATASPPINTNNQALDTNWGSPFYTSPFNDDTIDDVNEVYKAWVQSTSNILYFRLQTYLGPAVSNGNSAVAALDCDRNGNFDENEPDRRIIYDPAADEVYLYDGTNAYRGTVCTSCTTGERPTDFDENIEWMFEWDATNPPLEVFPADCRDEVNIKIATANNSTKTAISQSSVVSWNIPAVIELKQLQASSSEKISLFPLALIALGIVSGLVIIASRRMRKEA